VNCGLLPHGFQIPAQGRILVGNMDRKVRILLELDNRRRAFPLGFDNCRIGDYHSFVPPQSRISIQNLR
jgi:hypothetical protein